MPPKCGIVGTPMVSSDDPIRSMEMNLQKHAEAKSQLCNLDAIANSVKNKIDAIESLKEETFSITNQLHFYDMVDYLSNSQKSNINLKSAGAYLKELEGAIKLFSEDLDSEYSKKAKDVQEKLMQHGLNMLEKYFIQERYNDTGLKIFLEQVPVEKTECVYFKCRRKVISSKISECIRDIRKNYKLFIVGEISAYSQVFGPVQGKIPERGNSLPTGVGDLTNFENFLYEIFADIFKSINCETVRNIVDGTPEDDLWPSQIFRAITKIFYGSTADANQISGVQFSL